MPTHAEKFLMISIYSYVQWRNIDGRNKVWISALKGGQTVAM